MDCSSDEYITTYSEDERIHAQILKSQKEKEKADQQLEENRQFEYNRLSEYLDEIFDWPGIHFDVFDSRRIKFKIVPSEISRVSKKLEFIVRLHYSAKYKLWFLKRNTLPLSEEKTKIYRRVTRCRVTDTDLCQVIKYIYEKMVEWAENEEIYRREKFMRYKRKELEWFELDSDDEELFLSEDEIEARHAKKEAIWRRMLPPDKR